MYLVCFLVPESHIDLVKKAIFAVGAGQLGNYKYCAWQTLGEGQFMPLPGSQPFSGEVNQLKKGAEYKVEIICTENNIKAAVAALKSSHPYEVAAYQVLRVEAF